MTVEEIVDAKLTNTDIAALDRQLAIEEVKQAILTYCNISTIPEELNFTWANMSIELANYTYQMNKPSGDSLTEVEEADISSIKIGDTQVNLGTGGSSNQRAKALKSHSVNLDGIVLNYKAQLNRFRRVVW